MNVLEFVIPLFLISLSSAQIPRLRQAPLPPWTQCMDYSFAYPGWILHDIQYLHKSSEPGQIQFQLLNTAINYDVTCLLPDVSVLTPGPWVRCGNGNKQSDEHLSTFVRIYGGLKVSQTWKCPGLVSDNQIVFNAIESDGPGDISPLNIQHERAEPNITIPARLKSPVDMQPQPPTPPLNHDIPGCITTSSSPSLSWSISNIHLRWTPSTFGIFATQIPGVLILSFEIANPANEYALTCNHTFPIWGYRGGNFADMEDVDTGNGITKGMFYCEERADLVLAGFASPDLTGNMFEYDLNGPGWPGWGVFSMAQTWYCDDRGAEKPYAFSAFGTLKLTNWSCSDPPDAQGYTFCSYPSFSLPAAITNQTSLPPYELLAGPVDPESCTAQSFNSSSILITDIYINEKYENNTDRLILRFSHTPSGIDVQGTGFIIDNKTSFEWNAMEYSDHLKNKVATKARNFVQGSGSFTRSEETIDFDLRFSWVCNDVCIGDECRITFKNAISISLGAIPDTKYRETEGWNFLVGRNPKIVVPWSNTTWTVGRL